MLLECSLKALFPLKDAHKYSKDRRKVFSSNIANAVVKGVQAVKSEDTLRPRF